MDTIFKFFDRLTEQLPHGTVQMIRLGAVLFWLILATIAVFYAWRSGADSVPPSGQDLSQVSIREKVERARNLQNPPGLDLRGRESVVIPDTGEFRRGTEDHIPYRPDGRTETSPMKEGDRPKEPFSGQRPGGPPYAGEDPSIYPNRGYVPPRDPGASGTRDSRTGESESRGAPLLPPPSGPGSVRRSPARGNQSESQPEEGRDQPAAPRSAPARQPQTKPARAGKSGEPSLYPRRRSNEPGLLPPSGRGER